jgi:hypothetical protein
MAQPPRGCAEERTARPRSADRPPDLSETDAILSPGRVEVKDVGDPPKGPRVGLRGARFVGTIRC